MSLIEREWLTVYEAAAIAHREVVACYETVPMKDEAMVESSLVPADRLRRAVDALYSAHDFISRVLKWKGDDDTEQSELLAEIANHLPAREQ